MFCLKNPSEIRQIIPKLSSYPVLWLDTEIADWRTVNKRLSLIQVLTNLEDVTGDSVYLLDVLNQLDLVQIFIEQIMANSSIEKVFHNAPFDLKFLGETQAKNVTCTLKLARSLSLRRLGTTDLKLKTLAKQLCHFSDVDIEEQASDWGKRPLTPKQLNYAKMDTVYLAQVHHYLLNLIHPNPVAPVTPLTDSFSVTKVRVAFECPRLFYLAARQGGKTVFLPPETSIGLGNAFHDLSEKFVELIHQEPQFKALFRSSPKQLKVEEVANQMQELFYSLVFYPYLEASIQKDSGKAQALHQLWQGLRGLIQRWAELLIKNRYFCSAEEVINKTILDIQPDVDYLFKLPNGTEQRVRGKFDGLIYDCEQDRHCVVEYKTYQSPDQSAQLAQVALYSFMLKEKLGVPVDSAVYSVLPHWQELTFTWDKLENTVHQLIPHKLQQMQEWIAWKPSQPDPPPPTTQPQLCEICPQQQKCQTFFKVNEETKINRHNPNLLDKNSAKFLHKNNQPETSDKSSQVKVNEIGQNLINTLKSFNIGVDYLGAAIAPAFIRVKLKPHPGIKVSSLLKLSNDLQVQLEIKYPPLISPQAGFVSVDLPRSDRQVAAFESYIQSQQSPADSPVKIALGINLENQLVEADLSDPNTCHFLVGGTTGSGKSEFLRSLLLSLLYRHSPQQLKIALVDPKRVTFPEFEKMPWLYSNIVKTAEDAMELMTNLVDEMNSRYQRLEQAGCPDLQSYNSHQKNPLSRIVCIFDEYADFMAEKDIRKDLELSIKRLGAMARAAGIHLIIATQRPEAGVVTPIIRSNLPGRVALRTASEADSQIILGSKQQTTAAYLLGKGDLLYQAGSQLHRLQSLYASKIKLP